MRIMFTALKRFIQCREKLIWTFVLCVAFVYLSTQIIAGHASVDSDVYWGNYYRRKINELQFKPYKFHFNISCEEKFEEKIEDNMIKVSQYPIIGKAKENYPDVFRTFDEPVVTKSNQHPVLVTAASSNHYHETVAMVKRAQEHFISHYSGAKIVFYDIGLRKSQREDLANRCKTCEIRSFPFDKYPPYVAVLKNYVWKPIIIYTMLKEYDFVMWADSSVMFHGSKNDTDNFLQRAQDVGILVSQLGCECRSFQHTKAETFKYLDESICKFELFQLEATWITIYKTQFTWKYVIQPWIACALTENCMSHPNPRSIIYCRSGKKLHQCHRFDQSVLSIILQRIFNVHYGIVTMNRLPKIARIFRTF